MNRIPGLLILAITFSITVWAQPAAQAQATGASAGPMTQAIEMNIAEVDIANIAAGKTQDPRVKSFAEMMMKDHAQALSKLRAIPGAPASEVKSNSDHRAAADKLSKLSGSDFDREYMSMMVRDHEDALKFFEEQGRQTDNTEFAKVARDLVPTVKEHLEKAQKVQKDLDKPPNPNSSNPGAGNTYSHVGDLPNPGPAPSPSSNPAPNR
jgi:putative membrane protein